MFEEGTNKNEELKTLRTYTSDMADAVRTNEASVIKIALAEKEKREQEAVYAEARGTKTSRTMLVIGGIILIIGAIVGSWYLLQKKKETETIIPADEKIKTFILYNTNTNLDATSMTNVSDLVGVINSKSFLGTGPINALFLKKKINNTDTLITSKEFLSLIDSTAPAALVRSFSDNYLLGKYIPKTEREGKVGTFLIFETTNYSQSYASMLSWEKTMSKDLYTLFDIKIPEATSNTGETIFERQWKDIIINNRDTRVLYGDDGNGVLFYTFINKDKILIANDITTIKELISELLIKG